MTRRTTRFALLSAAVALAACDTTVRPIDDGGGAAAGECTSCHGDASRAGDALARSAPPASPLGGDGGAHLAHLAGGTYRAPLACAECHYVPTLRNHADGNVTVPMAGLAATAPASPAWDAALKTCSGVYCHGATLGGGPSATPAWGSSSGLGCTSCHGAPPPSPHPAGASCGGCHAGYTASSVNAATHINGAVDAAGGHPAGFADAAQHGPAAIDGLAGCLGCHGSDANGGTSGVSCNACHGGTAWQTDCTFCHGTEGGAASPPVDTHGRTSRAYVSVGAHAPHVGTSMTAALACGDCHPARGNVLTDAAHVDGDGVAEVVLGARAGASANYARASDTSATCASTACHGAAPIDWTSTAPLGCASCHGAPPPSPHTSSTDCAACHDGYTASTVNAATHLDGMVQASGHADGYLAVHGGEANRVGLAACQACHGTALDGGTAGTSCNTCHGGTAAWRSNCAFCHGTAPSGPFSPPVDTQGRTATTNVSVGAHAAHVTTALTATPIACDDCHPARAGDVLAQPAHVDGDARAEVAFSARSGGAGVVYARASDTSATCASTYCHGTATVQWTSTTDLGCSSCHGAPPPAPHSSSTDCGSCHDGYTASTVNAATHLDGAVQSSSPHADGYGAGAVHGYEANRIGFSTCRSCHGADLTGGSGTSCNLCHGGTAWQTNCTFCHGTAPSGPFSPPVDTQGGTATSNVSVGVHAAHVTTAIATPLACTQCHVDQSGSNVTTDADHVDGDGIAEVVFATGSLARTGGATATYTRVSATSATCASTYCHGQFTGGTGADPSWTSTAQVSCNGSCHGTATTPRSSSSIHTRGEHENYSCSTCHFSVVNSSNAIIDASLHVNGADEIRFTNGGTWTPSSSPSKSNCSASACH